MSDNRCANEELAAEVAHLRAELIEAWDEGYTSGYFKTHARNENPYMEGA